MMFNMLNKVNFNRAGPMARIAWAPFHVEGGWTTLADHHEERSEAWPPCATSDVHVYYSTS